MFKAVDTEDWRRKYLDSLRALEQEERQFRAQQQALYKLLGRLCLAAQGQSPRLDGELKRLKDAVRREVAPEDLDPLGQAIAAAVLEMDQVAATQTDVKSIFGKAKPEPEAVATPASAPAAAPAATTNAAPAPAPIYIIAAARADPVEAAAIPEFAAADQRLCGKLEGEEQIRGVLSRLLIELRQESLLATGVDAIKRELGAPLAAEQLPQIMERVGALVMQRIQGLERTRQELELLLGQMVSQLDSLTRYVDGSVTDETERSSSNATLNLQITGEMQALGDSVANGTDLAVIRRQLRQRMDSISRHLQDFHEREEQRARQSRERTDQMRGRMDEMETEARKLKARLTDEKRLSMRDPLTQIPNRLAYEQRIGEEVERWIRFSQPTCIAVWDIDGFKAINDGYGHRAGDKVLTVVAECLAKAIRSTDFVARYGGEEFVMLLPGTTLPDAIRLSNQMREAVARLGFHFRGTPVSVTISCGITALVNGDEAEDAFDRADGAMYRAKEAGRNCVISA